ncbi:hypothetical protein B0T10DRAFT_534386 [Thelonectria olida]|uniref:Uncharacterized protein n=1 Tax=Thelonectria olida TaxID=1576542 RepID=A0A9P8VNV4_9HYPO|nr:hypothetical protein B0T10DRAFT_534386 [Thelonectria olida]
MNLYRSILIKKPYATILSVPLWQPREAGRTADYCLYRIFPSDDMSDVVWLAEKPPLLPLAVGGERAGMNETRQNDLYGVVVVFKKRQLRPVRFVAICLANIGQPDNDDKRRMTFRPSCKVIYDWALLKAEDMYDIDFNILFDLYAEGEMLVMVQKVLSNPRIAAKGSEPRFIGLTQVVFDRVQMMDELHLSPNTVVKVSDGILQYYGLECSDEEIGDLI